MLKFAGRVLCQILKCGVGSKSDVKNSVCGINQMLKCAGGE